MEARDDDLDEDMVITDKRSDLLVVVENLQRCMEEILETVEAQKEALSGLEDRDANVKALHAELHSANKRNEQLGLEVEQLKLQIAEAGDTSAKDQEIDRLVEQIEKYQAMMEEQAEMIGKYSEAFDQEKVEYNNLL